MTLTARYRHLLAAFLLWFWTCDRLRGLVLEEAGAAGDVKLAYAASSNLTVTNLASLASSSDWTAGWESDAIDNTSNKYTDYRVTAKITVHASVAPTASTEIRLYLVGPLDDSTWPDVFDGTESAETITDTEIRDAICRPGHATVVDTSTDQAYYLEVPSVAAVFNGNLPKKFLIFITHNTGQTLKASGQQVTIVGSYGNVES